MFTGPIYNYYHKLLSGIDIVLIVLDALDSASMWLQLTGRVRLQIKAMPATLYAWSGATLCHVDNWKHLFLDIEKRVPTRADTKGSLVRVYYKLNMQQSRAQATPEIGQTFQTHELSSR